ncbi:DUF4105 domain-containing protein [Longimicrobium sp.]|uniref:Lnb N-terminal periplasmic domain-containing protein n=1 Tax=Longimicrobium sp. TaxID=2029185 RepID=UPI002E3554EA|nr:DUF4105 domain-containing protein [Longimicrobium sp.]HEX6039187.1 DUF4105 domain-containing protein [Longimicrobium sp.]
MPSIRRRFAALAVALGLAAAPARAQTPPPVLPDTGLTVVLLTMGQGDMVWEKFGHNALWIHDPARGTDRVYNYGMFDFRSPGYWGRFLKGNWLYELGVQSIQNTVYQYQYFNRAMWAQELNLTPAQKRELQGLLETNALPQNREYLYDYYRDNCSTRIRDVLDRVTGGALRRTAGDSLTGTTYRWHSERLIASDGASYFGLAGGLGPAADRNITAWEEMFLPFKVQQQVRNVRVADASGRPVPLVAREWTMLDAPGRGPERAEPPFWTPFYLLAGLVIAGILVLLGRKAPRSGWARFGFSAIGTLWLLLAGVGGLLLVLLWTMTNHSIAYRNENLLQLSPLALPLVLLVPCLAYGARWAARPARLLTTVIAGLSLLGFVLQVLPGLDQRNAQMIALALPINLALALVVRVLASRTPPPPARAGTPKRARQRATA